jgi:hypothetical protein
LGYTLGDFSTNSSGHPAQSPAHFFPRFEQKNISLAAFFPSRLLKAKSVIHE